MYVMQRHITSRRFSRTFFVGGALLMAIVISGCSAVNMTGFNFPVFGLTKNSANESDFRAIAPGPVESGQLTVQSRILGMQ